MSESKQLTVIEQQAVEFYGDDLIAVRAADGNIYVALSQMCDALSIDTQGQARRIERHTVLYDGLSWVDILSTQVQKGTEYQQRRQVRALRVDLVPLWLSGIRTKSVREEIRPKLERFQREAARVLWAAFRNGELSADNTLDELASADTAEAKAFLMAKAVYQMARQQLIISNRVEKQGEAIERNTQRIEAIESELGQDERFITVSEAEQISQAVRAIALIFSKNTGRNEYPGVYGELYRRFGINSYKRLPAAKFDEAMNFLRQWWEDLTDRSDVPF